MYTLKGRSEKNVTIFAKTDHSMQILDIELLVPRCSAVIALYNGEVRIVIA